MSGPVRARWKKRIRVKSEEEEDAFVDRFGPGIADDLWTCTRPAFIAT